MKNITRRQAFRYLAGAGVVAIIPRIAMPTAGDAFAVKAARRLFGHLESRASAAWIGLEYLREYPSENNIRVLGESLDFLAKYDLKNISDQDAMSLYAERISQDFESGDVVNLEGWILSKTEARVFALLALV